MKLSPSSTIMPQLLLCLILIGPGLVTSFIVPPQAGLRPCKASCYGDVHGSRSAANWRLWSAQRGDADTDPKAVTSANWATPSMLMDKVLLGIEPSPEILAVLVVYFVQGAIGECPTGQ